MTSVTKDNRYSICQKHREYLYLIYYLGDKILTAVQLYHFSKKTNPSLSKSKYERDLKGLEDSGIIRKELICLNADSKRVRVLYLRKYAVAYIEGVETTIGVNNVNFSRLSPAKILKHVVRAERIFSKMEHISYNTILDPIQLFKSNLSAYWIKQNQYHYYMTDLYNFFQSLDLVDKDLVNKDFLELQYAESENIYQALEKGRQKGSQSSPKDEKKEVIVDLSITNVIYVEKPKETEKSIFQKRIDNYGLTYLLNNFDIYFLRHKEGKLSLNLDMIITKTTSFSRIMADIIGAYHYFSSFLDIKKEFRVIYNIVFINAISEKRFKNALESKAEKYYVRAKISHVTHNLRIKTSTVGIQTKYDNENKIKKPPLR